MTTESTTDAPPRITEATDPSTGRTYYLDHTARTTSWEHPRHTRDHEPYTPGLPYPFERHVDELGRAFYHNHETGTTSWMNPARLTEVKEKGLLEGEGEGNLYGGEDGEAWRGWVLGDVAEPGPKEGWWYWVNYRTGKTEWQSPEDKKIALERIRLRKAAESAESAKSAEAAEKAT